MNTARLSFSDSGAGAGNDSLGRGLCLDVCAVAFEWVCLRVCVCAF